MELGGGQGSSKVESRRRRQRRSSRMHVCEKDVVGRTELECRYFFDRVVMNRYALASGGLS